jgi:hypothetical protein
MLPIMLIYCTLSGDGLQYTLPDRDSDFCEFFSGCAAISAGLKLFGFVGISIDKADKTYFDIMTPIGFLMAVRAILRTKAGGLVWFAPPCGPWTWMCMAVSGRTREDPLGNKAHPNVVLANRLVSRVAHLWYIAHKHNIHVIIEQPSSSVMYYHPRMKQLEDKFHAKEKRSQLGAFAGPSRKDLILKATAPITVLDALEKKISQLDRDAFKASRGEIELVTRKTDIHGKVRVTGSVDLKPSQAYPIGFGTTLGQAFDVHCKHVGYVKASRSKPESYDINVDSDGSDVSYDSDLDWLDEVRAYCAEQS